MAEVKWIKITTNMFDDEKIRIIESMPEADAILVIWIKLLALAGKCNRGGFVYLSEDLPYTEEMLATIFNRPLQIVHLALQTFTQFGMICHVTGENVTQNIYVTNWEKHQNVDGMERIREQNRQRKQRQRQNQRELQPTVTERDSHVTVTQQNKTKNKNKNIYTPEFEKWYAEWPRPQAKSDSSRNFERVRRERGLDYCLMCTANYIAWLKAEPNAPMAYASNNFFGMKAYYLDYEVPRAAPKKANATIVELIDSETLRQRRGY